MAASTIAVPPRAAALIAVVIAERNNIEAEFAPAIAAERALVNAKLQQMIEVLGAGLGAPKGAQLRLNDDGTMAFVSGDGA